MNRPDITPEDVAAKWLQGDSIMALAAHYGVSEWLIQHRLKTARETLPDLPWNHRTPRGTSPTRGFVKMTDGKPGTSAIKAGSIIRSNDLRRRP